LARVLPTAFLVVLLAATTGAFALTQKAKLQLSYIYGTRVAKIFSPACGANCPTQVANIKFKLRHHDRLTVWVDDTHGKRVATVISNKSFPKGEVDLAFTGIAPNGLTLPDGEYTPVIRLLPQHWQIVLPDTQILLDTKAPVIKAVLPKPRTRVAYISPDGDGHHDRYRVGYTLSEPAHAILYVRYTKVETTYRKPLTGTLTWNGYLHHRAARPGRYVLSLTAVDAAGNRAKVTPFAIVYVRYISLARTRIDVRHGRRFSLRVARDAPTVSWILNGRHGTSSRTVLLLRAPKKPGRYKLYVTAGDHTAKGLVVVH
jgi:hypothetical protein